MNYDNTLVDYDNNPLKPKTIMQELQLGKSVFDKFWKEVRDAGIIYKDEKGAVCRCFNYRECVRTCLSEDTTSAFMIIETVDPKSSQRLMPAIEELALLIKEKLKGETEIFYLEKDRDEIVIE